MCKNIFRFCLTISILFFIQVMPCFAITDASSNGLVFLGVLGLQNGTSIQNDTVNTAVTSSWIQKNFTLDSGVRFSKADFQCMAEIHYWPLQFGKVSLGLNGLFHFGRTFNLFSETDFHIGPSVLVKPASFFAFFFDVSYSPKISYIDAFKKYGSLYPWLNDQELAFQLGTRFFIYNYWLIETSIVSYEDFSYPLFFWPAFTLSCMNYSDQGIVTGMNLVVRYTDMFTLTSYFDGFELQFILGYKF